MEDWDYLEPILASYIFYHGIVYYYVLVFIIFLFLGINIIWESKGRAENAEELRPLSFIYYISFIIL